MSRLDLADGLRLIHAVDDQAGFGHRQHLEFAWAVLSESQDTGEAIRVVAMTIRHTATAAGNPGRFHATVTAFWVKVLAHVRDEHPEVSTLDEAIDVYRPLLDAALPERHWSDIDSERCKREWVEPDLEPLP